MKEELQRLTIAPMAPRPMAPELTLNGLVVTITDARPRLALEAAVTAIKSEAEPLPWSSFNHTNGTFIKQVNDSCQVEAQFEAVDDEVTNQILSYFNHDEQIDHERPRIVDGCQPLVGLETEKSFNAIEFSTSNGKHVVAFKNGVITSSYKKYEETSPLLDEKLSESCFVNLGKW